jgi:aspartyl protease family protein
MQHILVFAFFVLALAAFAPKYFMHAPERGVVIAKATPETPNTRTVAISPGAGGHFWTDGVVDGRRLNFLVDTGASAIALRESDAARLGIHPARREYTMKVATANGALMAAPIELNRVEIGDLTVRNVSALILPDEALGQNLLGMSFLARVHWQYQLGRLVLEQ